MKALFLSMMISSGFSTPLISQKVYTVSYASQADAILYETRNKSEADIFIYKVDYVHHTTYGTEVRDEMKINLVGRYSYPKKPNF